MARRAGGSVVVALCLVAAALGTSMAGADELHVVADWGGPLAEADVVAVGYTWHGIGLIWGWGDDVVCYRWTFTDTMTQVDGRITNVREAFEVSTPPIDHQFNSKGHHQIWLSAWWEKNGPATAVTAKLDVAVVEVTITSETVATAREAPDTRTELGIGELVWCTAETDPADVVAEFWWEVTGVGEEGPNPPEEASQFQLRARWEPGGATVTAHIGSAKATKEFAVVEPNMIEFSNCGNLPPGTRDTEPPLNNIYMGCHSEFNLIVWPKDVSFRYAEFREHKQVFQYTWPNGTPYEYAPKDPYVDWTVEQKNNNPVNQPDECANSYERLLHVSLLESEQGYDVFEAEWSIPEEYRNEEGGWTTWLPDETHVFQYIPSPASYKGKVRAGIRPTALEFVQWGTFQGPFETINTSDD